MQTRFTKPELAKTLKRYFPDLENELLEAMAEVGHVTELRAGQPLMYAGQQIRNMIFVLEGNVKIVRHDDEGSEFFMYSLTPGDACALSLTNYDRVRMSAVSGVTLEDGMALLVPVEYLERWIPKYKSWAKYVINAMRERMEDLLETFDQVAFRNLDERLEFYLKRHQRDLGMDTLEISHQQIAADLNTSREVISRLLKKLEQRGKVQLHRNAVEITDL